MARVGATLIPVRGARVARVEHPVQKRLRNSQVSKLHTVGRAALVDIVKSARILETVNALMQT